MVMCIPNLVYNSLDARYNYFSAITIFVSEMTLEHVVTLALGLSCNTYCGADSMHFWGESCKL